jgi:GST-like protein
MLEEIGLPYQVISIDITKGRQHEADFLKISPNAKIPAIVDHDAGISLMESGAILIYLAEKTGKFLPGKGEARARTIEWLMFQMGGVGPMLGQTHHFLKFNPDVSEYATERYKNEAIRIYGVLEERLGETPYLAGNEYSIADIATWPWVSRFEWQQIDLAKFSNLSRWYKQIAQRPAVQRGYVVPHKVTEIPMP